MEKYHIGLTSAEQAILATIDLRASHQNHDEGHASFKANKEPILALLKSLSDRSAIPQERLNYWNDPEYKQGRMKASRKEVFERNGCHGADIYMHPHFIPYLRYFLFGAELPDAVITAFEEKVGNPQWVTSGDIVPIGRVCTRSYASASSRHQPRARGILQALSRYGAGTQHGKKRHAVRKENSIGVPSSVLSARVGMQAE